MKLNTGAKLTEAQIEENYNYFIDFVKNTFTGERKDKLLKMYDDEELGLNLATNPASPFQHFHLCQPGGYVIHVMNVCKAVVGVKKLYEYMGGTVDFTDDEMLFAALHHDLGKLGMIGDSKELPGNYYVNQDSEWHRKNTGEMYKMNDEIQYMEVTDRALYLLQRFGITYNWKEMLGIKLTDGIYNEANKKYLVAFRPGQVLKTSLPYVLHTADYISCKAEYDNWKRSQN